MGSYKLWRAAADRSDFRKKFLFVCGTEKVLVEEVIEETKRFLNTPNFFVVDLDYEDIAVFNDLLFQHSLSPEAVLIVVRHAEATHDWSGLREWLDASVSEHPRKYLILTSTSRSAYDVDSRELVLPAKMLGSKGRVVECKKLGSEDLLKWVARQSPTLGPVLNSYLIKKLDSNMSLIKTACVKLNLFSGKYLSPAAVDELVEENVEERFATLLILGKKSQALSLAEIITSAEYPRVLGELDKHLDMLSILNKELRKFTTVQDRANIAGVGAYWAEKYKNIAYKYDDRRVASCRSALAYTWVHTSGDGRLLSTEDGLLPVLITLWV